MSRKTLEPSDITAIVDTREQTPWSLDPLKTERGTLATGDYSIKGLESEIALERKSLSDLLGCIGNSRARFEAELERLAAYSVRAVIVECSWSELEAGAYRSRIKPSAACGSVLGWVGMGIPFLFAGGASSASTAAARLLFISARRRWGQLGAFYETLRIVD